MPAPRGAARLWTGKVLPSTVDGSPRLPAQGTGAWKTGDEGIDKKRAMARIHPHRYTTANPGQPCDLCGSHPREKVAGKLIHPDPRPVRPEPVWRPRVQPPKDSPPKKKAHKPKKKATPPKASKPNKAAPLKVMPTPTAPVQSDLFIAEKADGRRLVPSGDYQGEWVSADLRFLVEEMAVRHRNGQIGTRFIVTDLAIQRGTKKVVHTVGSFEDAEAWVRSL